MNCFRRTSNLGRKRAGKSTKMGFAPYRNAIIQVCEDNAIPYV